jgi:transcriptional regulator with XRE-family HTH domain
MQDPGALSQGPQIRSPMRARHSAEYREFLQRLKQARHAAGLTQAEVAHLLERPQSYVSKCESGERRVDVVELREFARVYGRTISFFIR